MQQLYNNRNFTISMTEHGGLWIDNNRTGYTTSATIYANNTVGYDYPGILTKAMKRAINTIVERETGRPALVKISPLGEYQTYSEHFNL